MNKSTKTALQVIIVLAAILFGAAVGQSQNSDEIVKIYRKALELNEGRFDDPNLIYVGDTVLFPSRTGNGIEAWIADEPSEGQHDSFWVLSEKYLAGEIETIPADTMQVVINTPEEVIEEEEPVSFSPWWWITLIILIIAILLYAAIGHYRSLRNPDNYKPVGGDIDVMTREQTLSFVFSNYLKPGDRIVSFRTGTLENSGNKKKLAVEMQFGDSKLRTVDIPAGERISEAVIEDRDGNRRVLYLRNACSNGFSNGEFSYLPTGWYINYQESEEEGKIEMQEDEKGEPIFVIKEKVATEDAETKNTAKSNLGDLVEVIKALNIKGSNIDINFIEKPEELSLSLKVSQKKGGKKKTKKA
ncbi:MAG: hypothetical protein ACLFNO_03140 [Parcubacteria group bacterium]